MFPEKDLIETGTDRSRSSPTAYNVFTAYSITSAYLSNGVCTITSGSAITLPSAYSEILPEASGKVYLDAGGQQSFIDYLGFTTCSGGGVNIQPTALIQVTNTTVSRLFTWTFPDPRLSLRLGMLTHLSP